MAAGTEPETLKDQPKSGRAAAFWVLFPLALFASASVATILWGRYSGDEGWYLYLSGLVAGGKLPYRDFLFTQTPLSLYFFSPATMWFPGSLIAARTFSALAGFGSILFTVLAARKLGGNFAAGIAAVVLATSMSFCNDVCSVKTPGVSALFLAASFYFVSLKDKNGIRWTAAVYMLSLGVCARLSLLPALFLFLAAAIFSLRKNKRQLALVLFAGLVPAGVVMLACWLIAGEKFLFGIFAFHHAYYGLTQNQFHPAAFWAFALQLVKNQGLVLALGVSALILWIRRAWRRGSGKETWKHTDTVLCLAFFVWFFTTFLHATRFMPYAIHQTMLLPVLVLAVSVVLRAGWERRRIAGAVLPILLMASLAMVPFQEWPLHLEGNQSPAGVKRVAHRIGELAGGEKILTFDPGLATLSGLQVIPGYKMGEFNYFPGHKEPGRYGLTNNKKLSHDLLTLKPAVVAMQGRDLARVQRSEGGDEIISLLEKRYSQAEQVDGYGQFGGTLYILIPGR